MTRSRIEILAPTDERGSEILTPEAIAFITRLHDRFLARRNELRHESMERARHVGNGRDLGFPSATRAIRENPDWRVAGPGPGLEDRRVEITGPTDRKMTVNALNSGAKVWLADGEDALSPTWENVIGGQVNLADAIRRRIDFTDETTGKRYELGEVTPTIVFRPRGWHLTEKHLRYVDRNGIGAPASGSLVDFGLYAFHNAAELIARGRGPYFYLPKTESHLEARLWDDVFTYAENALGLAHGTIRATVLIETAPAAFEMEEILYELRDHCAGLNAGRWDYIFSIIKYHRDRGRAWVLPDRAQVTMTVPFMAAYTDLLVQICHKRGAQAIGGMSAFIPDRRNPERTTAALDQVAADKRREAAQGFDGTWVAHPGLVETARAEFDAVLGDRPDQRERMRDEVRVTAKDLLDVRVPEGRITRAGVRTNVSVGIRYLESWLRGVGAAAIDGLMEDAATAEISRSQLWQWMHQAVETAEGDRITPAYVDRVIDEVVAQTPRSPGDRIAEATEQFREVLFAEDFPAYLTIPAYAAHLVSRAELAA